MNSPLLCVIALPAAAAAAALAWPDGRRRWLLPAAAVGHSLLTLNLAMGRGAPAWGSGALDAGPGVPGAWLALDALGLLLLCLTSALFLGCSVYAVGYLHQRRERDNRYFTACLLAMLSSASVVAASRHLGLLWVAMEAATLSAGPLILFKHSDRSLEATWKYLIMGSVGIGLALLGTFFLALSAGADGGAYGLHLDVLLASGPRLSAPWLKGAFIFILVGYGTKMGLAPLHSWKPDAYGEAPGLAGAVLAGVLTSCAFMGILRVYQVMAAAGQTAFAGGLLVFMGLLSLAVAAVFMLSQRDFKRLLAYSSVEHMGLLVLGLGLGGPGLFAALLHLVNNALAKGLLFLTAANIHRAYGDKTLDKVHGAFRLVPASAGLFLFGVLAVTGAPPFAPFVSEFALLRAAAASGRPGLALAVAGLLAVLYVGIAAAALAIVHGEPPARRAEAENADSGATVAAPAAFALAAVAFGLHLPAWLSDGVSRAAALLAGGPP